MGVTLNERVVGDVTILKVTGRITLGEGSRQLREKLRQLIGQGQTKILLDLGETSYMDSSGIGTLIDGFTATTNARGQLKIGHISERVRGQFQFVKLYTVFDVYDNEEDAIRSFN